ncbi:beta-glucosidase family 9 [Dyella jiangningensis]|uniref:glycoside hydrolase family 9 protein n=1 Tax=Dyella sp. AtDHG13 TaxID=1938897 RepID=UPI00089225C6|nr:glycoside hydrolase family 9 protein [Dyella sp. AtDHG13]PXV53252.1 beta-glucosidase (glycosyl hydrolase family 9) [Dyella sp. AtDHG13]SDL36892.1 beta-glucosidase family 9 [Dyella jiangningensis]
MKPCRRLAVVPLLLAANAAAASDAKVLVDQVGYDTGAIKQAIVMGATGAAPQAFRVVNADTGNVVLQGTTTATAPVARWNGSYAVADFSSVRTPGHYYVELPMGGHDVRSWTFDVQDNVLERHTLSNVVYYFKGQRSSGLIDKADTHLAHPDGSPGTLDIHGGWYDATGDYGIHLSHQNLTSYFNPQQVPLAAWSLLRTWQQLEARKDKNFREYNRRLLDEGLFGADFLVRDKRPDGSFYQSIDGPGPGKLPQDRLIGDPNWRTQIKLKPGDHTENIEQPAHGPHAYEASFRGGGGMAIAALALAAGTGVDGDFGRQDYLKAAEDAYRFLDAHNRELINDGKENIVDDYCALLAAVELYRATHDEAWRKAADGRADRLMARLITHDGHRDYWRADDGTRPFFHPADAGLPVVALVEYAAITDAERQAKVRDTVKRSLQAELAVTADTNNPFGYARQLVRYGDGRVRTAFFFPHDTEAAPWWQGENARLASLAAAARLAAPLYAGDDAFRRQLQAYAWNQLHWILGRNPYDSSMLMGSGHNNAPYMFFDSYAYTNAPGAIINGITSGLTDDDGIAFDLGYAQTGKDDDWRWTEQWLPHDAWYLFAISLPHD